MLDVGALAPQFALTDARGETVRLPDLLAGRAGVALFFFPRALTPGCTQEACDFAARAAALAKLGVAVAGISPDAPARQATFAAKHDLGALTLLSDPDHAVADAFGAWGEKRLYGRRFEGVLRSTFLVDASGAVTHVWRGVKVNGHADAVLEAVKASKRGPAASPIKRPLAKKMATATPRPRAAGRATPKRRAR